MRRLSIGVLIIFGGNAFGEGSISLDRTGVPFQIGSSTEIVWAVPTNQEPRALWVYKNIPQAFSDEAISNLLVLSSFTVAEKKRLPSEILAMDKNALHFRTKDEKRYLTILPSHGWIEYGDSTTDDMTKPIEDVPTDAEAQQLALDLLDRIEIPRSELATRPNSSEPLTFREIGRRGHFDKEKKKSVEEIRCRGVFFIRQVDHVNFAGIGVAGGFYVNFASHGKVAELRLVWRNMQPYEQYAIANPDQIIEWIKEGKTTMPAPNVNSVEIKKLTITQVAPLYMGALGDEPQDFTCPFAQLETVADLGNTNVTVQLYCPILSTNVVGP